MVSLLPNILTRSRPATRHEPSKSRLAHRTSCLKSMEDVCGRG